MGKGLTEIQSPQGFAAETASTTVILTSAHLGFALSTTQVASGSILGAGLGRRLAEVRWSVAGRMVVAWLVTLPAAALVGAVAAYVVKHGGDVGTAVVALVGAVVAVVVVFSLGVLGLARGTGDEGGEVSAVGRVQAGLCFLACAAVVGYGIYLIVPQFH